MKVCSQSIQKKKIYTYRMFSYKKILDQSKILTDYFNCE
jgi:hypothetical protein